MKPIIFSTPMVQAILAGRKTQTRRVIKLKSGGLECWGQKGGVYEFAGDGFYSEIAKPPYKPGDILWVRETWRETGAVSAPYAYKADEEMLTLIGEDGRRIQLAYKWRPSIHMPRTAARIFLRVTDVRVERVQDIGEADAIAEGIYKADQRGYFWCDPKTTRSPNITRAHKPKQAFMWLWMRINDRRDDGKCAWLHNPWVWVYTFERITKED